eukprot:gene1664-434_t
MDENPHQQLYDEIDVEKSSDETNIDEILNNPNDINSESEIPIEEQKPATLNLVLLFTGFVIILGSFQYGFAIGVLNTPKEAISGIKPFTNENQTYLNHTTECGNNPIFNISNTFQPCVHMEPIQWNIFVSSFIVTALIGSLLAGVLSDFIGRRTVMFISNGFFIVGAAVMCFFSNFYFLTIGRMIHGFGVGLISTVAPVYLSEISPSNLRGAMTTLHQLSITIAILVAQTLGIFLSFRPGWRYLLSVPIPIGIIQSILLVFCPMSPKWLVKIGWQKRAEETLKRLRKSANVSYELNQFQNFLNNQPKGNLFNSLFRRELIKPIFVGITLHVTQQLSGVNAVIFYSTSIFQNAGVQNASIATAIIGLINVIATIFSVFLIEKLGRKILLLVSEIWAFFFYIILSISFILTYYQIAVQVMNVVTVISVVMFIIGFAIGLGPIPWVMTSELFPDDVRGFISSCLLALNWSIVFLVGLTFDSMDSLIKPFTFIPFTIVIGVSIVISIFFVSETKGTSN